MPLTPEGFNKIALKTDMERLENKIESINAKIDRLLTNTDGLAKKVEISEGEKLSNLAAHDRFENRITNIEKQVGLAMAA
jgi:predicted nuclease with TOPRIM domain